MNAEHAGQQTFDRFIRSLILSRLIKVSAVVALFLTGTFIVEVTLALHSKKAVVSQKARVVSETIKAEILGENAIAIAFHLERLRDETLGVDEAWFEPGTADVSEATFSLEGTSWLLRYPVISTTLARPFGVVLVRGPIISIRADVNSLLIRMAVFLLVSILLYLSLLSLAKLVPAEVISPIESLIEDMERLSGRVYMGEFRKSKFREISNIQEKFAALIKTVRDLERDDAEIGKLRAIAQTTQMLAHDVRKPFSILKIGFAMLSHVRDPAGVKAVLDQLGPVIDAAVSSVDGMISDVMEIGSASSQLSQSPVRPESLIVRSLNEIFRVYPKVDIYVDYRLEHTHMVNVHKQKVERVFSNIAGNAIQAMKGRGELWFKTRQNGGFVEFCIGNSGSYVPAEDITKLFEAFFTRRNAEGGTGLGLAIAQKVVAAHGGKIWCESILNSAYPSGKVEFFFTLPIAHGNPSQGIVHLPVHSSEIIGAVLAAAPSSTMGAELSSGRDEASLEAEVIQAIEKLARPLRVLLVDDEAIYRKSLLAFLSRSSELQGVLHVSEASSSAEAIVLVRKEGADLIVTDIDMGAEGMDGFDLVKTLRTFSSLSRSIICVSSNRIVSADLKKALQSGADTFLPKPMTRTHLLKLLLQGACNQGPAQGGSPQ